MGIGDIIAFNDQTDTNISKFCYDRNITGVIVDKEYNRYIVRIAGFDTIVYVDPMHVSVVASREEIALVNYGVI